MYILTYLHTYIVHILLCTDVKMNMTLQHWYYLHTHIQDIYMYMYVNMYIRTYLHTCTYIHSTYITMYRC